MFRGGTDRSWCWNLRFAGWLTMPVFGVFWWLVGDARVTPRRSGLAALDGAALVATWSALLYLPVCRSAGLPG